MISNRWLFVALIVPGTGVFGSAEKEEHISARGRGDEVLAAGPLWAAAASSGLAQARSSGGEVEGGHSTDGAFVSSRVGLLPTPAMPSAPPTARKRLPGPPPFPTHSFSVRGGYAHPGLRRHQSFRSRYQPHSSHSQLHGHASDDGDEATEPEEAAPLLLVLEEKIVSRRAELREGEVCAIILQSKLVEASGDKVHTHGLFFNS